jgi:hypothetical protein
MAHVDLGPAEYLGLDVVEALVAENTSRHGRPGRRFARANILSDPLPTADIVVIRDLVQHLSDAHIFRILETVCAAEIGHVAITSHRLDRPNADLETVGGFRPVDLARPPFALPVPMREIRDWEPGYTGERYLSVWPVAALRAWKAARGGEAAAA